jgi:hypothetical protein
VIALEANDQDRPMTMPLRPALIIEFRDAAESADDTDTTDPMESTDAAEPIEPIDAAEPIEPTDNTDPRHPMHSSESSDHNDHFEPMPTPIIRTMRVLLPRETRSRSSRRASQEWTYHEDREREGNQGEEVCGDETLRRRQYEQNRAIWPELQDRPQHRNDEQREGDNDAH